MTPYYLVIFLTVCIFGMLLWLTRKYKSDGEEEEKLATMQKTLKEVGAVNEIKASVARMFDNDVSGELRSKWTKK